jgi:dihydroorotase
MSRLLIRGGRVLDPANNLDAALDILAVDGRIERLAAGIAAEASDVIEARGLVVTPGFIDLHTHLREPGFEYKETVATGTLAAARGGFTTVCAMPNTEPAMDSRAAVEFVLERAKGAAARVLPIGCVTKGRQGKLLAEMGELATAGCVAFSDDGSTVADASLMRRALEYASGIGRPIIDHCEDPAMAGGVMHEGWVSTRLGLRGIPSASEENIVARDISLARQTGAHVHIAHLSTAGAVDLVRRAKAEGVKVTAEVTPHHLALTHEAVMSRPGFEALAYDTNAKMYPPLRSEEDRLACIDGLADGTIDAIATDHAPHAIQEKLCEFDNAANGIVGLETALALVLTNAVDGRRLSLERVVEALTAGPARALDLERFVPDIGTLRVGAPADIAVIDAAATWVVDPAKFASKGKNTPLAGVTLRGRVVATVFGGRVVHQLEGAPA